MAQTPNLLITEVAANQNQKEVTINTAFTELEAALTNVLDILMPDADYTLGAGEGGQALGNLAFVFSGVLTEQRNIFVPNNKKLYLIMNATEASLGMNLNVTTEGGSGVVVACNAAQYVWLYCDGTNVVAIGA